MALSLTMGAIVTRCKRRANREGDDGIETSEWKALVSEVYGQLHSFVAETGMRYFESTSTITADGSASYSLPTDHLSTIGVDLVVNAAGVLRPLYEIMVQERPWMAGQTGEAVAYELSGSTIVLYPKPSTGTYKHLYVPQPTDVSSYADGTSLDLVCADGEVFLVNGVAAIAKDKNETDYQFVLREREQARERLTEWAALRALNQPRRRIVRDVDDMPDEGDWRFGR